MFEAILQHIAPHLCFGCQKTGVFLCNECKNDIIFDVFTGCIWCGRPLASHICVQEQSLEGIWIVGLRRSTLKRAIDGYKFHAMKTGVRQLAQLLHVRLPLLPANTIITTIPTVRSHVRSRGYDHTHLLAREVAVMTGLPYIPLLQRIKQDTQHTASRNERMQQAEGTYELRTDQNLKGSPILLIDDIITTGATIKSAITALRSVTDIVFVAALAYQPLDE